MKKINLNIKGIHCKSCAILINDTLEDIKVKALEEIKKLFGDSETRVEEEAIGFGLSALKIIFVMDESKPDTTPIEEAIKNIEGVISAEVVDVRKAL